jgi:hypothetical protein
VRLESWSFGFAAIQHLARHEQGFDRLADSNVIRNQHPDGIEAQRHQ